MKVTQSSLASALEGFVVRVGSSAGMGTSRATIADADETAEALFATLGRMAALREDDGARKPQVGTDPELAAMAAILPALPLVSELDPDARDRVMDWARRRACDSAPPF